MGNNSYGETKPIGLKHANELGLFDMSGNVLEWCGDWYDHEYYEKCAGEGLVIDPRGPAEGSYRVLRGGSCSFLPELCRSSDRNPIRPGFLLIGPIGFRLVVPCQSVG